MKRWTLEPGHTEADDLESTGAISYYRREG
jgi:hypothetical protein